MTTKSEQRKKKLAEALKANLKRRKDQGKTAEASQVRPEVKEKSGD
jgi:hypothetical protein